MSMFEEAREFVEKLQEIPPLPDAAAAMLKGARDAESSLNEVRLAIEMDASRAGRLLKLVNSRYYGLHARAGSIEEAIILLGFKTMRSLCLSVSAFDFLLEKMESPMIDAAAMWGHAIGVAGGARKIAQLKGYEDPPLFFAAGLLHDAGKIVLMKIFPEKYAEVIENESKGASSIASEEEVMNVTHCQAGAWLCRHWGLPNSLLYPVLHHHTAEEAPVSYQQCVFAIETADCISNEVMKVPHDSIIPEAALDFTDLTSEEIEKIRQTICPDSIQTFMSSFSERPR